jgi:hypothetical protein
MKRIVTIINYDEVIGTNVKFPEVVETSITHQSLEDIVNYVVCGLSVGDLPKGWSFSSMKSRRLSDEVVDYWGPVGEKYSAFRFMRRNEHPNYEHVIFMIDYDPNVQINSHADFGEGLTWDNFVDCLYVVHISNAE